MKLLYIVNKYEVYITGITNVDVESICIPECIDGLPVKEIETCAFSNMKYLKSVFLPETMTMIRSYAFSNCPKLEFVSSESVDLIIHYGAFKNCTSLCQFVTDGIVYLSAFAFSGCEELRQVTGSIRSIADNTFGDCKKLKSLTFSNKMHLFCGSAFYNCDSLAVLVFEGSQQVLFSKMNNYELLREAEFVCDKNSNISELVWLGYKVKVLG